MNLMRILVVVLGLTACAGDAPGDEVDESACEVRTALECLSSPGGCQIVEGRHVEIETPCVSPETTPFACREADASCPLEGGVFEKEGDAWRVEGDCPGASWERIAELTDGRYFGPDCTANDEPAANCEGPFGSALQLFPSNAVVFFSPKACIPPTSILLINQGDETIRIDAFRTGNFAVEPDSPQGEGELIASAELPQELAPSDSLAIDLRFVSETPGVNGTVDLVALTSKGCERFVVTAVRSGLDDGLISHPLAVDLGTASPGTLGKPVDIVFRSAASDDGTIFTADGVSDGIFEVVNPIAATPLRSCEPMRTSVRFDAPLEPGVYEGLFAWEILTDTQSGIGFVHLRGRVQ